MPKSTSSLATQRSERIRRIVEDCIERRTSGESVSDASLLESFPDLRPELEQRLRQLRLIQEAQHEADKSLAFGQRGLQIRCPHCRGAVEIVDDTSLAAVVCSSCGSRFNFVDEPRSDPVWELDGVGHFRLLDRIGTGAFGSVWSACDTQLDRNVAIKFPRKGQMSADETEQFIREARAAAQLNHPNIVRVHEVGREAEHIYIVSDLVEGLDLAQWLSEQSATAREAAELCETIADALHHAHEHGVVHRDLKPSNIMLDQAGEPHLLDFGLAKREAAEITMTVEGKLLGTPAYMSPEQARGTAHHADRRSDVYSVGVILFELLAGERPFRGTTRMLLHQVLVEDAPSPRKLNHGVPRDLETICLKCLEKDPSQRYQTAGHLRDDLKRFLNREPVLARPITRLSRSWRWCRRKPVPAGLGAVVVMLLLALAVGGPTAAVRQAALATENRRLLYFSDMDSAREAWERHDLHRVLELLRRHAPRSGEAHYRALEWYYLWKRCQAAITTPTFRHSPGSSVCDIKFTDGGRTAMSVSRLSFKQWDAATFDESRNLAIDPTGIIPWHADLSPDGSTVAFGHDDGRVTQINVDTEERTTYIRHGSAVYSVQFSPGSDILASGDRSGEVKVCNAATGSLIHAFPAAHPKGVNCIAFSRDGTMFATGGRDETVKLWAMGDGQVRFRRTIDLKSLCEKRSSARSVTFSPDGKTLAVGTSGEHSVLLCRVESSDLLQRLMGHRQLIGAVAFSRSGRLLASASDDKTVRIWDVQSGQIIDTLVGHSKEMRSLAFDPDDTILASGSRDGTVKLWNLDALASRDVLKGHTDTVFRVAISPDGRTLASASNNGELKLWDLANQNTTRDLVGHNDWIRSISFSLDGDLLASASLDKSVRLWSVATGESMVTLPHESEVRSVAISPDQTIVASGSRGITKAGTFAGTVTLWDIKSGQPIKVLYGHEDWVACLAFSPEGDSLASGCSDWGFATVRDATVKIWDLKSGHARSFDAHSSGTLCVTFAPDGKTLATSGEDDGIKLWNLAQRRMIRALPVNENSQSIVFTSDGKLLISGGDSGTLRFWDVDTGQLRFEIPAHTDRIMSIALSTSTLITGSQDTTIKLWRAATEDEVQAQTW